MNPYSDIRKVPLDYNGIQSSAFSVQMDKGDKWKEVGVVGNSYMLLPNQEVKDAADQVVQECDLEFTHDKTFFNGKNYMYSLKSDHIAGTIKAGDDVALGVQFWNSYDGSRSFGFSMMLYRLLCTNGMMSKKHFNVYRFKHEPKSDNWDESIEQVIKNINSVAACGSNGVDSMIHNLKNLSEIYINMDVLGDIRHKYIADIPVGLWGQIIDRFTKTNNEEHSGWDLLNAATDILWHKEKPTVASYEHNGVIVDGLCRAVS